MDQFKIVFSPQADRDLRSIASTIARNSGFETADCFGNRLIDRALKLTTLPERGRVVPEIKNPEIREIIYKSYRIIYRVRGAVVQIVRFWHAARGAPEIDSDEFSN